MSERERRHFLSAFPRLIIHAYPHRIFLAHRDSRPGGSSPASTLGWTAVRARSTGLTQRDATSEVSPCIGGRKSGPFAQEYKHLLDISLSLQTPGRAQRLWACLESDCRSRKSLSGDMCCRSQAKPTLQAINQLLQSLTHPFPTTQLPQLNRAIRQTREEQTGRGNGVHEQLGSTQFVLSLSSRLRTLLPLQLSSPHHRHAHLLAAPRRRKLTRITMAATAFK